MNPKVSVIIPTFNRSGVIKRAIDSVLNQSYQNFELIVVDDGSTDKTYAILEEYTVQSKIKLMTTANRGVSAARNLAVRNSQGQWVSFLDSDDEWLKEKLQRQMELVETEPSLKIIHTEEIWIRNGIRVNQMKKHQKYGGDIYEKCLPLCLISPSTVLIKKELYLQEKGFNENLPVCEDYDLWLRLTAYNKVGFIKDPLIKKYGGHDDQLSKKFLAMDYFRVLSLNDMMGNLNLTKEKKHLTQKMLLQKCNILLNGYKKHGNLYNCNQIEKIFLKWNTNH